MDNISFEFESKINKEDLDTIINYISKYHLKNVINIKKINLAKRFSFYLLIFCIISNIYFGITTKFDISSLVLLITLIILFILYILFRNPLKFIKYYLDNFNKISILTNKNKFIITNSDIQHIIYLKNISGQNSNINSKYKLINLKKVLILNEIIILHFNNDIYIPFNLSKNYYKYNDFMKFIKNYE